MLPVSPASGRSRDATICRYEEMVELDYLYVTSWSLLWDVRIIARTARVVLSRDGAY